MLLILFETVVYLCVDVHKVSWSFWSVLMEFSSGSWFGTLFCVSMYWESSSQLTNIFLRGFIENGKNGGWNHQPVMDFRGCWHGMMSGATGEWPCGPARHGPLPHAAPAGPDAALGRPRQQPRRSTPGLSSGGWGIRPREGSYGGFLKWGYPEIIHFSRIVHYQSSTWIHLG